jgi:hypothetical protein
MPNARKIGVAGDHCFVSRRGEIDEFHIHVIPILIGEGIPLNQPRHRSIRLELLSSKAYPDGVVDLNYRVKHTRSLTLYPYLNVRSRTDRDRGSGRV